MHMYKGVVDGGSCAVGGVGGGLGIPVDTFSQVVIRVVATRTFIMNYIPVEEDARPCSYTPLLLYYYSP